MQTTTNLGLKKPGANDTVNVDDLNYNADVLDQEVAARIKNTGNTPSVQAGLDTAKPTPGTAGRLYVATDTQIIYRDTGTAWAKVGVVKWGDIDGKPASFPPSAHKTSHATGGSDALAPADIGAAAQADLQAHVNATDPHPQYATDTDLAAHLADVAPHSGYVAQLGVNNQVVNLFKALNQQIDTRGVTLAYDANGRLTTITEKDGATTVKTMSLSYDANGNLTTVTEQAAGKTITTTLAYDASGNLTSIARSVA